MFERRHHQLIGRVLETLDGQLLRDHHCLFAGGTAIALREGEFRESVDIDFVISDLHAYRELRDHLHAGGLPALFVQQGGSLKLDQPLRMDQYGLRSRIGIDGQPIKLEIIHEARLTLAAPGPDDQVCGIASATRQDLATMKLLANADRWADDSVFSRDILDLAHLTLPDPARQQALLAAEAAYGLSVRRDLGKALGALRERKDWLDRCLHALSITTPKAVVWQRLRALRSLAA